MKVKLAIASAALLLSGPAFAGGFSYGSAGGNLGNWAYNDAAAGGQSACLGIGYCSAGGSSKSKQASAVGRSTSMGGAYASNHQTAKGFGVVSAHSSSSALSGGGTGLGIGFKIGNFGGAR